MRVGAPCTEQENCDPSERVFQVHWSLWLVSVVFRGELIRLSHRPVSRKEDLRLILLRLTCYVGTFPGIRTVTTAWVGASALPPPGGVRSPKMGITQRRWRERETGEDIRRRW